MSELKENPTIGFEIFEKATKSCFLCQSNKEKMLANYSQNLFICKECAILNLNIGHEIKKFGKATSVKIKIINNKMAFCNWHNENVTISYNNIVFILSPEEGSPGCCTNCLQKAADL